MRKKKVWPILVKARTQDPSLRIHRIHRYEEGAGNAEAALMRAVLKQRNPGLWLGCEIRGITLLGQKVVRVFEWDRERGYHLVFSEPIC